MPEIVASTSNRSSFQCNQCIEDLPLLCTPHRWNHLVMSPSQGSVTHRPGRGFMLGQVRSGHISKVHIRSSWTNRNRRASSERFKSSQQLRPLKRQRISVRPAHIYDGPRYGKCDSSLTHLTRSGQGRRCIAVDTGGVVCSDRAPGADDVDTIMAPISIRSSTRVEGRPHVCLWVSYEAYFGLFSSSFFRNQRISQIELESSRAEIQHNSNSITIQLQLNLYPTLAQVCD